MAKIDIRGDIIVNEWKRFYDWLEWDSTCPRDVQTIIEAAEHDEPIDVYINSPGGIVEAGQEIYTALLGDPRVNIYITGQACSAASFVAMAGHCSMTPVGLMMVHCASMCAHGNHNEMEAAARELTTTDRAIANAYATKSGMDIEKALRMMERETWLTANQCVELGLVDEIIAEGTVTAKAAAFDGVRLTPEIMQKAEAEMQKAEANETRKNEILADLYRFGSQ